MVLLDLLGRRWMLRILWELREDALTFRALREACGDVSPSVLNTRLKELRDSGLVMLDDSEGYALTPLGKELLGHLFPLHGWAERWAKRG
jgi:DNA-binding HxlR family transcriptional regulator